MPRPGFRLTLLLSLPAFRALLARVAPLATGILLFAFGGAGGDPLPARSVPVTVVTDIAFRELPNWRGLARGAITRATEDLAGDAGLVFPVAGETEWEPPDYAAGLDAVLAAGLKAVPAGDGITAIFLGSPPQGLPGGERGYAFLSKPGFLVFAPGADTWELGRGLRDQLAMLVRHELGHVFGIPHLRGANVMAPAPEGRAWTYGELGIEVLRANRGFRFGSEVPFAGCALDTLRDVYELLDQLGEMEPALFVDLAWAYRARGDLDGSEELFRAALRRDRTSPAARFGLAKCAVASKDTLRALGLAEELAALDLPLRAQVELGALWIELRRFAVAESLLAQVVLREQIPEAWFNLGLVRLRLRDRDGAVLALRRYFELDPDGPRRKEVLNFLQREPPD